MGNTCPTCGESVEEFREEAQRRHTCSRLILKYMVLQHRLKTGCRARNWDEF